MMLLLLILLKIKIPKIFRPYVGFIYLYQFGGENKGKWRKVLVFLRNILVVKPCNLMRVLMRFCCCVFRCIGPSTVCWSPLTMKRSHTVAYFPAIFVILNGSFLEYLSLLWCLFMRENSNVRLQKKPLNSYQSIWDNNLQRTGSLHNIVEGMKDLEY